jgi:hypothetical protein
MVMKRMAILAVLVLIIVASLAVTASAAMAARPCPPGTHPQRATAGPGPPVFGCVANP